MPIVHERRPRALEHASSDLPTTSDAPRVAPRAPAAAPHASETALRGALDRLPVAPEYAAFLNDLRASASRAPRGEVANDTTTRAAATTRAKADPRDIAIRQRLDGFRDRFAGPYSVAGETVSARPMFRMNVPGALNATMAKARAPELHRICARAGVGRDVGPAMVGRPSPEQLVRVTQALLDAGKLPDADDDHRTVESRIRLMQWQWGIGVDCAGYTQQAAADAHGAAGRVFEGNLMGDIFTGMGRDRRFTKVDVSSIRPGDVIHLDPPSAGGVGHNVIVYSHVVLDAADRAQLTRTQGNPDLQQFFAGRGPFRAIEVDSSWGAADGQDYGGFRRDSWIVDESSGTWATWTAGKEEERRLAVHRLGPQEEIFAGAYRPKGGQ